MAYLCISVKISVIICEISVIVCEISVNFIFCDLSVRCLRMSVRFQMIGVFLHFQLQTIKCEHVSYVF